MAGCSGVIASGDLGNANWVTGNDGSWFDDNNWVEGQVPTQVDQVRFGVGDNDFSTDTVDIDNNGAGVNLETSRMRIERKMIFSDSSATEGPTAVDDGLTFDRMDINGSGGAGVIFNVPVTTDTMTTDRHGGIFNQPITVNNILATSRHQNRWQINASATAPVTYLLLDENRGPDGGDVNGTFSLNSDIEIVHLDHVWGRLRVAQNALVAIQKYHYFDYRNQAENNNINPMNINGTLVADVFFIHDTANETTELLDVGSYGSLDNETADFQVDFITGDGLLVVESGDAIFSDSFEANLPQ